MTLPLSVALLAASHGGGSGGEQSRSARERSTDSVPPASYSPEEGEPYCAGHRNFSGDKRLGVAALLDGWARDGVYPAAAAAEKAFGDKNGFEPNYEPAAWPAELDT